MCNWHVYVYVWSLYFDLFVMIGYVETIKKRCGLRVVVQWKRFWVRSLAMTPTIVFSVVPNVLILLGIFKVLYIILCYHICKKSSFIWVAISVFVSISRKHKFYCRSIAESESQDRWKCNGRAWTIQDYYTFLIWIATFA